jgi:hypothetical protein
MGSAFTKKTENKPKKGEMPPEYVSAGMLDKDYGTTGRGDTPNPNKMRKQAKAMEERGKKEGSPMKKNGSIDTPADVANTPAETGAAEGAAEAISAKKERENRKFVPREETRPGDDGSGRKKPEAAQDRKKNPPSRTASPMKKNGGGKLYKKDGTVVDRPERGTGLKTEKKSGETVKRDLKSNINIANKLKEDPQNTFVPKNKGPKYGPIPNRGKFKKMP